MLPNFSLHRDTKTRHDIIDNLLIYKAIFSGIFPASYLFCGDVSLGITLTNHFKRGDRSFSVLLFLNAQPNKRKEKPCCLKPFERTTERKWVSIGSVETWSEWFEVYFSHVIPLHFSLVELFAKGATDTYVPRRYTTEMCVFIEKRPNIIICVIMGLMRATLSLSLSHSLVFNVIIFISINLCVASANATASGYHGLLFFQPEIHWLYLLNVTSVNIAPRLIFTLSPEIYYIKFNFEIVTNFNGINLPRPLRPTKRRSLNLATWFFITAVQFLNSAE